MMVVVGHHKKRSEEEGCPQVQHLYVLSNYSSTASDAIDYTLHLQDFEFLITESRSSGGQILSSTDETRSHNTGGFHNTGKHSTVHIYVLFR